VPFATRAGGSGVGHDALYGFMQRKARRRPVTTRWRNGLPRIYVLLLVQIATGTALAERVSSIRSSAG